MDELILQNLINQAIAAVLKQVKEDPDLINQKLNYSSTKVTVACTPSNNYIYDVEFPMYGDKIWGFRSEFDGKALNEYLRRSLKKT